MFHCFSITVGHPVLHAQQLEKISKTKLQGPNGGMGRVPNGFTLPFMVLPRLVFRDLGIFAPQGRKLNDFKGNLGKLMVLPRLVFRDFKTTGVKPLGTRLMSTKPLM